MNKLTARRVAENILIAANVFFIFLLVFEDHMRFPAWLQSVGRMHPLLLHLPIVLLLLAMGMEFFRFNPDYKGQQFYQDFTTIIFLAGALSASVTAIMGLLLSKESGYTGDAVQWHKWAGMTVALFSSLLYFARNSNWYRPTVARFSSTIAVIILVVASHFGAGITHGENFISAPMITEIKKPAVAFDKAIVYADIVAPVLQAKCVTCHNASKAKGELLLGDSMHIVRGGKSGKAFIVGNALQSLLIERINLPEEEKKHMPLSGKPQLTSAEKELLTRWINEGASFKTKLADLPDNDSLRIVATKFIEPAETEYGFAAADQKTVQALNNNYRVIVPLATESPALSVDFFNRKQFSSKSLEELLPLKDQIVQLSLIKMPVRDEDLKTIAQFTNLEQVNLNFTDIDGSGLTFLSSLKALKAISLAGTAINEKDIEPLLKMKSLHKLFIWNTKIGSPELANIKASTKVTIVEGYQNDGSPLQLNVPILVNNKMVFSDTMHVRLKHPIRGAELRYTLDGSDPDSVRGMLFGNDIVIDKTSIFKARAYKATWSGSDSIVYQFYKTVYTPDSVIYDTLPNPSYNGNGPNALFDHRTGDLSFGSGKWVGFQKDFRLMIRFANTTTLQSVAMRLLKYVGADIYPPEKLELWGGQDTMHLKLLQTINPKPAVKGDAPALFVETLKFSPSRIKWLRLVGHSVKKSPKWGNSPGKPGWIFTDEIFFN